MGHQRLGSLPKTRSWNRVVGLLDYSPLQVDEVADATVHAANNELIKLKDESSISYCFWLLTRITWHARFPDFVSRMNQVGIDLSGSKSTFAFISSISDHVRTELEKYPGSTVFREISSLALRQALSETIVSATPNLFGSNLDDIQSACKKFSSKKQFGILSRRYFASYFSRLLLYFLDKELSNHIGTGQPLESIDDSRSFKDALAVYSWQTSKIVEDFASGWYSKNNWQSAGDITLSDAKKFTAFAMRKFQMELDMEELQ
jgi:hypothetical protein